MKLSLNLIVRFKEELAIIIKNSFPKNPPIVIFQSLITALTEYTEASRKLHSSLYTIELVRLVRKLFTAGIV
jgi:hypothetical protein